MRAAIFGAMDGLVTNIALIAGVGGGGVDRAHPVLTGVAGLVAGAISMGLGEYTSVRTQNEQVGAEVAKELHELRHNPEAEADELVAVWVARGLPAGLARQVAGRAASGTRSRRCGCTPRRSSASCPTSWPRPWTAAFSSFVCFSLGAVVPLLPYLLGFANLWLALGVGGVGLFVAGALVAGFTNRSWWRSGLRQLILGAAAAAATYLIGVLIGVGVT